MTDERLQRLRRGDDPDAYLAALARVGVTLVLWHEVAGRPVMAAAERAWRLGFFWSITSDRERAPLPDCERFRAAKAFARDRLFLWPGKEAGAPFLVDPKGEARGTSAFWAVREALEQIDRALGVPRALLY